MAAAQGSKRSRHSLQEAFEVFLQPGSAREVCQTGYVASEALKGTEFAFIK